MHSLPWILALTLSVVSDDPSCVIDAMLDVRLKDRDIVEFKQQIAVQCFCQYRGQVALIDGRDGLFNVAIKQINDGFNVEKENRRRGDAVVGTMTSYLALPGPTSTGGSVIDVLFIICVNSDCR